MIALYYVLVPPTVHAIIVCTITFRVWVLGFGTFDGAGRINTLPSRAWSLYRPTTLGVQHHYSFDVFYLLCHYILLNDKASLLSSVQHDGHSQLHG
jgi:hypothetical protein